MQLRRYKESDCHEIIALFKDTVHKINATDYTPEQLDAWAPSHVDEEAWNRSLAKNYTMVAIDHGCIVGFGDITSSGYLDHLFVHALSQRQGIAAAICNQLEAASSGKVTTEASITARPFFEKRGYVVVRRQKVERHGIKLVNFVMEKIVPAKPKGESF
jgi:putative acetyltransferase